MLKLKVTLSLYLSTHCMTTYRGRTNTAPHVLNLSTGWRWGISFMLVPLYLLEKAPGTHYIGGWVTLDQVWI
jgi:hypothetical protein